MSINLYFKHDLYALEDRPLKRIVKKYSSNGYAVFFVALELLYKELGEPICCEDLIEDISDSLHIEESVVSEIINDCIENELFNKSDSGIYSDRVKEVCEHYKYISAINSANRKGSKNKPKSNTKRIEKESLTNRKGIAIYEDEDVNEDVNIKVSKKADAFTAPTLEEIKQYCTEKNLTTSPDQFYNYFTEGNWKDAKGNKVRNWKQKLLTWEKFNTPSIQISRNPRQLSIEDPAEREKGIISHNADGSINI